LRYSTDLFDSSTITRMLGHFETLLQGIVAEPRQRLSDLPLLSATEKQQLLVEWNDTARPFPQESCIHHLFEEQVERTPDAPALSYEGEQVSYAELNARANRLAHYLRAQGVGPEVRVGIYLERSIEMLVAVLAVLKAGGAYVPLDPGHPPERISFMVQDAGLRVVLRGPRQELPPDYEGQEISLDQERERIGGERVTNVVSGAGAENLAYVIYTSGSTGKPKGVLIQHRSALNLTTALERLVYQGYPGRPLRVSLNAPLAFDASVKQILTLLFGSTLYIVPEEVRYDRDLLLRFIAGHELNVLDCTPSQLTTLIDQWCESGSYFPQVVLVGGEAIDRGLWQQIGELEGVDFYNVYGPTECTVDATICRVRESGATPNIGRPVANTQAYLLDRQGHLVPVGVPGELYLGGEGVARGYLERPDLTAERFLPDPFSAATGARLYKTGDLARYLSDGCIEFLGRLDQQVKVRGYRIELGEVEAELSCHFAIREAIVSARGDPPNPTRLVAYLILMPEQSVTSRQLKAFLKKKLPDYMIPSTFVFLDKLPLGPNGKVDRKALPVPNEIDLESTFVAPRTSLEQVLAGIWEEVLNVDRVGIHDSFFELGGHSLLAAQAVSRLRQILQVELPLRNLFEMPRVAELAEQLIKDEVVPGQISTTATLLIKVAKMSPDEVKAILKNKKKARG
jgi:amino acid adenylation domain-containing protein